MSASGERRDPLQQGCWSPACPRAHSPSRAGRWSARTPLGLHGRDPAPALGMDAVMGWTGPHGHRDAPKQGVCPALLHGREVQAWHER